MMKIMASLSMGVMALLTGAAPSESGDLLLVEKGQPKAVIVTAEGAGEKVKLAAQELQSYLQKMTGAKLEIVSDSASPRGAAVLVGKSKLTQAMKAKIPEGLTHARREEGFLILCKGSRLVLAGNDEGPYHGTEYAVYEFLRRLGVRWFMPGDFGEDVPQAQTVSFPETQILEKPDFVMRNWWLHARPELLDQERRWKIRNKMNPDEFFATPGDSSVRNIVGDEKTFKEHPEYFALNLDGTRNPHLPNLTHPRAVEIAADIIKEYFCKNPNANSYGFAPDDGLPRDFNPETVKLNQGFVELGGRPGVPGEVSTSEEWFAFVNKVTAEVRKEFPHIYIATNGYANRDIPPQGIKLDDHLIIMFAAIWSCTLHAYDDDRCWQKVLQGQMLKKWAEMCPNVWIYGYNYGMLVSGLTPLPMARKLRRDFPLMKKWGVMGFLDETRNVWAEASIPGRYLRAQLEWNANADADAILEDFYARWYGRAARPMRAFYNAIEDTLEKTPLHGHEDRVMPFVYTPEMMETLDQTLRQAEEAVDTERVRLHVRADRLIYEHLKGYMAMSRAEACADWPEAVRQASAMMELRQQLHTINPFFIWPDEDGYHTGIWYWGVTARKAFYQSLADKTGGQAGDLIALLPEQASFKTDPYDEGVFGDWHRPDFEEADWKSVRTTRPFYLQGYMDSRGRPYTGYMWYRLKVDVPASAKGRKVILYAPTMATEAWCWVNGHYAGYRPYLEAYIRPAQMELDVTDMIRPGQPNTIAVRVSTSLSLAQAAEGILARMFLYSPREAQP